MAQGLPQPDYVGPKMRPLDMRPFSEGGEAYLLVRDPLGINEKDVLIPAAIAPLLALCDGSRDIGRLQAAFELTTGQRLALQYIENLLAHLDDALLLESPRFALAQRLALRQYREAPHRPPALAGVNYPSDGAELTQALEGYCRDAVQGDDPPTAEADAPIVGVISPHIDYQRGWRTYAQVWQSVAPALDRVDLAVVFGTAHAGRGSLILTRQNYATPLGVLPTAVDVVDAVAAAYGEDDAFAEELCHRKEHSVELATVWLHHFLGNSHCQLVPVLCGSFESYVNGSANPEEDPRLESALQALREVTAGQRLLVVAAADLSHVGPAFGDRLPLDIVGRARLAAADGELLATVRDGDAGAFFQKVKQESDRQRICGLPPVYLALRLLQGSRGDVMGYAQCPADPQGGSLVSIAGVVLRASA